jgi:hypothetical protein
MRVCGQSLLIIASVIYLRCNALGSTYSLAETTVDGGGGPATSLHYASDLSVEGAFAAETAITPSGVLAGFGYIGELNDPPVPQPDQIQRDPGKPLNIPVSDLLKNVFDVEGQTFTLLSVSSTSRQGVPIQLSGNSIIYRSTSQTDSFDSFTYTVTDEFGGTSEGTVIVRTGNPAAGGPLLVIKITGNTLQLSFQDSSGKAYQIQAAESLSPANWSTVGTAVSDPSGKYNFVDSNDGNLRVRFYRLNQL